MEKKPTIALIGAGNMGGSLLGGLVANGYLPNQLWISDQSKDKLDHFKSTFDVNISQNNLEVAKQAEVLVLAVKPQILNTVITELSQLVQTKKKLIISIAAGVREQLIQKWFGGEIAIVRAMPNIPALIGCGATALYANEFVSAKQKTIAESILRSVGVITWLDEEKWMDIVTTLSGSGPAFYFLFIEAFQKAAEQLGLPSDVARLLTLQTAYGATRMALESEHDVMTLRAQVTSKGGTTEQAIRVLEENKLPELLKKALVAGKERSEELSILPGSREEGDGNNA